MAKPTPLKYKQSASHEKTIKDKSMISKEVAGERKFVYSLVRTASERDLGHSELNRCKAHYLKTLKGRKHEAPDTVKCISSEKHLQTDVFCTRHPYELNFHKGPSFLLTSSTANSVRGITDLPGWLLKSSMRWWDCSRSGLLDDKFPLTGRAGGICLDCFRPTMLSSWDWPTPTSLQSRITVAQVH